MSHPLLTSLLLMGICFSSLSCSMLTGADESAADWVEHELSEAPPVRDLLTLCQWAAHNAGFPPGFRDVAARSYSSGWSENLQPYSNRGRRYQAVFEVEPMGGPGFVRLRVRVIVEKNTEIHRTLESTAAKWEPLGDDVERAEFVLTHVLVQFQEGGASETLRAKLRKEVDKSFEVSQ